MMMASQVLGLGDGKLACCWTRVTEPSCALIQPVLPVLMPGHAKMDLEECRIHFVKAQVCGLRRSEAV